MGVAREGYRMEPASLPLELDAPLLKAEHLAAMDRAETLKRKADTIVCVVSALKLALSGLDVLRPLHYGQHEQCDRQVVKLGIHAEHFVKEELACLPLAIKALEHELRDTTSEHEAACARVRELDPRVA